MKSINISKTNLIQSISSLVKEEKYSSDGWAIYVHIDGEVDFRHNTHLNDNWAELMELADSPQDENGKYANDQGYDAEGVAQWIVDETDWVPGVVGGYKLTYSI